MLYKYLNFSILNLLYILCGFAFMTSLYSNPIASIGYRAIGIFLPIMCIIQNKFKLTHLPYCKFNIYLTILLIYSITVLYTLIWGEYSTYSGSSKSLALLFLFGVTWLPILGYIAGLKEINYTHLTILVFIALIFVISKGYLSISSQDADTSGRFQLNASQSTLAFGDKGIMLSIASAALLLARPQYIRKIYNVIFLIGLFLGIMAAMKGGSRGPLISGVISLAFLSSCASGNIKKLLLLIFSILIFAGAATLKTIHDFAPTLYDRILLSIITGDSSGRDEILTTALRDDSFIFGGKPIILNDSGFFGYHNVYVTLSMGVGIILTCIFIVMLIQLIYKFNNDIHSKSKHNAGEYFVYGLLCFYIFRGLTGVNVLGTNEFNLSILMSCHICYRYKLVHNSCRRLKFHKEAFINMHKESI